MSKRRDYSVARITTLRNVLRVAISLGGHTEKYGFYHGKRVQFDWIEPSNVLRMRLLPEDDAGGLAIIRPIPDSPGMRLVFNASANIKSVDRRPKILKVKHETKGEIEFIWPWVGNPMKVPEKRRAVKMSLIPEKEFENASHEVLRRELAAIVGESAAESLMQGQVTNVEVTPQQAEALQPLMVWLQTVLRKKGGVRRMAEAANPDGQNQTTGKRIAEEGRE